MISWRTRTPSLATAITEPVTETAPERGRLLGTELTRRLSDSCSFACRHHYARRGPDDTVRHAAEEERSREPRPWVPIMLSHTWFRDLKLTTRDLGKDLAYVSSHWNEQRAQMHRGPTTLRRIRQLGGVLGAPAP